MKNNQKTALLPCLILGAGGICAALRALIYALYTDESGLVATWNAPGMIAAIIALCVLCAVVLAVRPLGGANGYAENFPRSISGGCAELLAASGILFFTLTQTRPLLDPLAKLSGVLGILAAISLVVSGVCRMAGKKPAFLLRCIVSIFFAVHLINNYRIWSGCPQFHSYIWQLFAEIGLLGVSYYHAAFCAGLGRRRRMLACGMLTAYACLVAITDDSCGFFYCTCGLWALFDLCALTPPSAEPPEEVAQTE